MATANLVQECLEFLGCGNDSMACGVKLEVSLPSQDLYDCLVIITVPAADSDRFCVDALGNAESFASALELARQNDANFFKEVSVLHHNKWRVIHSATGPLARDQDDIRVFSSAAIKGVKRALSAGAKKPLVVLPKTGFAPFTSLNVDAACVLGALEAVYVPLEIREDVPEKKRKVSRLGFLNFGGDIARLSYLLAIESGRLIYRDIGGSDPERMAPPRVEEYVNELFKGSAVSVKVMSDVGQLKISYPCFAAVDRCARHVSRHSGRMILLEYDGRDNGVAEQTLALVGKGVTYDTGGADIKAGGIMAGMHRDKCGAATVCGFFQTLAVLKPKGLHVFGAMCMVRNSVGSDSYVSDELIVSRAGVRVRVGNTDAEGRMAMVDALAEMKEKILQGAHGCSGPVTAHLFTIATLTGHARISVGAPYSISIDNGPAKRRRASQSLQLAGEQVGDMIEISTLRREDFELCNGKSEYEDVMQCNNQPSTRTSRGHQLPAAFMIRASGLDRHDRSSSKPIAYSHLDIAPASEPFPGILSGAPIPALAHKYIYPLVI